jgi:hypothetical protein
VIRRRVAVALVFLLILPSCSARADEAPLSPDRPSFSNNADTVPPAAVQLETGLTYSHERIAATPAERRLSVDALARVGLSDRLEVRLEGEPIVRLRGEADVTDHGDLTLGFKYRVVDYPTEGAWPALAILPSVKFPIASAPIGSERPDFTLTGIASFSLPAGFGLDVNLGLAAIGQRHPSGYLIQVQTGASLGYRVTTRLSVFGELFFLSPEEREGRSLLGMDTGVTYLITERVAVDAALQTSVAGGGPDYALRAGFTVRFGR